MSRHEITPTEHLRRAASQVRTTLAALEGRTAQRDDLIREAVHKHGMSYREVGAICGISHARVQQIVGR